MSFENQVMELLAEGNPATEVVDAPWLETEAAAYLATLETRSSEMTDLDTKPKTSPKSPTPRRWILLAAAVALVAVLVVPTLFVGGDPEPEPTAPVVSTTVPEATQTTVDTWDEQPPVGSGPEGRTIQFEPSFFAVVGQGWDSMVSTTDELRLLQPEYGYNFTARSLEGSVDEVVQMMLDVHSELGATATDPTPTTVGGAAGVTFESSGLPVRVETLDEIPWAGAHDGFSGRHVPGAPNGRLWVVDVSGETVILSFNSPTNADNELAEADDIIDSIVWKDLRDGVE